MKLSRRAFAAGLASLIASGRSVFSGAEIAPPIIAEPPYFPTVTKWPKVIIGQGFQRVFDPKDGTNWVDIPFAKFLGVVERPDETSDSQ